MIWLTIDPAVIDRLATVLEIAFIFGFVALVVRLVDLVVETERDRRTRRKQLRQHQRLVRRQTWQEIDHINRRVW